MGDSQMFSIVGINLLGSDPLFIGHFSIFRSVSMIVVLFLSAMYFVVSTVKKI